ncbi:MAG: molybdate ABC transporter substrate-binding protein [Pseudomonadota bacterium]|nr:molybdate ABC transporter substrate-binding protein [Pseudomonadota bacterium]
MHPLIKALLFILLPLTAHAEEPVRIYAAASLTNALTDVAAQWTQAGHPKPVLVFAASSALAKQIENGAPADVFASADLRWMDYLAARSRIEVSSRVNLLGNELVLIAPIGKEIAVEMQPGFDLAGVFNGKLCTGEPDVVPVGAYAKQALMALGWWTAIAPRIVGTNDVRTALAFVERGECPLGIVYATDAVISSKVSMVARFPGRTYPPIVYPFALVAGARPESAAFLSYLKSDAAADAFRRHGFVPRGH